MWKAVSCRHVLGTLLLMARICPRREECDYSLGSSGISRRLES